MPYIDTWRSTLKTHLAEFAPLAKDHPNLDKIHSLIGSNCYYV